MATNSDMPEVRALLPRIRKLTRMSGWTLTRMSGWTREQLASKLDVSPETVREWEAGGEPIPSDHVARMSELFGVKVVFLLHREPPIRFTSRRVA